MMVMLLNLSESDRRTPLIVSMRAHFEQRLLDLRMQNDAPLGEPQHSILVGRIQEVKNLLALLAGQGTEAAP